ncbi:MAG: hypothetical protein FJ118_17705 [Deltaproteobacteria bacterium]|nr:hypothetical protein [Deltaproteobacteria bacterium]
MKSPNGQAQQQSRSGGAGKAAQKAEVQNNRASGGMSEFAIDWAFMILVVAAGVLMLFLVLR